MFFFFFFKQKTAYEMRISDWSSDVCSSDLPSFGEMALATDVVPFAEADLALLRTAVDPPGIAAFAEGTGSAVMGAGFLSGYPEQGMVSLSPLLTPVRSEEHTSELQSLMRISYAVFCLKKKKNTLTQQNPENRPTNHKDIH